MPKNYMGVILALTVSVFFFTACGSRKETDTNYLRIGLVKYSPDDAYINELTEYFKNDIEELQTDDLRISVSVKDAALSQRTENERVEELIDEGCDILCVNLVDRTAPSEIIDMAQKRDIPVIFINREPVREDLMLWNGLYYVGSDASESGVMQGELAADYIRDNPSADRNKDGKIQYILLEGEPDHQDAIIRTEKSVSTILDQGIELEKLSYQIANWSRAQAKSKMSQMITKYGNQIELVLANNDEMALGVVEAYDAANVTETERPVVFGIDGTQAGLQAVADGILTGTVYHDGKGEASAVAELVMALSRKDASSSDPLTDLPLVDGKCIYLSYSKVDSENLRLYLDNP